MTWEVWHKNGRTPLSANLPDFPAAEAVALNEADFADLMLRSPKGHWFAYNHGSWAAQADDAERELMRAESQHGD